MKMTSRIAAAAGALFAAAALAGFAPSQGHLRVYNISQVNVTVSVDGGAWAPLGNSEFTNQVVPAGGHRISVKYRTTLTSSITLTAANAYHSPTSGDHWCVRGSPTAITLLPVSNCEQLVDFGG